MLYHLVKYLSNHFDIPGTGMFLSLSFRAAMSIILALVIGMIFGRKIIRMLQRHQIGEEIRNLGLEGQLQKRGTPTMGGIIILISILVPILLFGDLTNIYTQLMIISTLWLGAIGFIDDYVKFFKKQNAGLSPSQKMILQFTVAAAYIFALYATEHIDTVIKLPFTSESFELNIVVYCLLAVVGIVFTVNSVNLTDGIDGLASSITAVVMVFMAALGFKTENEIAVILSGCVIGGTLGFLVYNFYPAKVFMGDTGSLFLGAAVSSMAFVLDCPLLLIFTGFMYYVEAFSVIIQVTSYKLTKKRVFKMTPIHHHFEMSGWSEIKIVTVFSVITALTCTLGSFGFLPVL